MLHYEEGITPIEIVTLPALIQQIQAKYKGCVLRLDSVQTAAGGVTVTLVVEEVGQSDPVALTEQLQASAKQLQVAQREACEHADMRRHAEYALRYLSDEVFPKLLERAMERSGDQFHFHGSVGRDVVNVRDSAHVDTGSTVIYTTNDLAAIEALVSKMLNHFAELSLSWQKHATLETSLTTVQREVTASTPNHSLIKETLRSVRTILEEAAGGVLASGWLPLLQSLQNLG